MSKIIESIIQNPGKYKLRKHQVEAMYFAENNMPNLNLYWGVGSGKSAAAISIIRMRYAQEGKRLKTLILGPVVTLGNWKNEWKLFSNYDPNTIHVLNQASSKKKAEYMRKNLSSNGTDLDIPDIVIVNYDGIITPELCLAIADWKPDIIVGDECFKKNTLVDTPHGTIKIQDIKVGDTVYNLTGTGKVISTSKKRVYGYIVLNYGGKEIICSESHPFLTKKGWVTANNLKPGDLLANNNSNLSSVPKSIREDDLSIHSTSIQALLKEVQPENSDRISKIQGLYRKQESYENKGSERETKQYPESDGAQATNPRRQWSWANGTRNSNNGILPYVKMESRSGDKKSKRWQLPNMLQTGPCNTRNETWNRGRWSESPSTRSPIPGPEKNTKAGYTRLESITYKEFTGVKKYTGEYFYDIGVSEHPSYSVNGVIVHNCHRLKSSKAKRTKVVRIFCREARYKIFLTGTAVLNAALDVFSPFLLLDNGETFGTNEYVFQSKFMVDKNAAWKGRTGYFPKLVTNEKMIPELNRLMFAKSIKKLTSECVDLPAFSQITIAVEASSEQKQHYNNMLKLHMTFIQENKDKPKAVTANLALTKGLRLQQIASGYIQTDDGSIVEFKNNPRLDATEEILEGLLEENEKVILWCSFVQNYRMLEKLLQKIKVKYCLLTGEQKPKEKDESIRAFQEDSDMKVIIANRMAGGIGVNLTAAKYSIVYSRNFSLEEEIQSTGRNYRGGSEHFDKIVKYDLCLKNSIDEKVLEALKNKQNISDLIMDTDSYKEQL